MENEYLGLGFIPIKETELSEDLDLDATLEAKFKEQILATNCTEEDAIAFLLDYDKGMNIILTTMNRMKGVIAKMIADGEFKKR